jgi:hypothetical protein
MADELVRSDNLALERRWPHFTRAATAVGAGSILAYRLSLSHRLRLSLNLYSTRTASFVPDLIGTGWLLAEWAVW